MRNLKRALSLALASVMLMGMMVVGSSASAKSFTDADKIDNKEAVAITTGLGIFDGRDDGSFGADDVVTRAEAAVVIAKILHGADVDPSNFVGTTKFTDVPAWAEGWVNLAASLNIIVGYGDGKFGPNDPVTTVQFTTMLLKALGYYTFDGALDADWALTVTSKATALGLYGDLVLPMNEGLTRENVAQLTWNALWEQRVAYEDYRGIYVKSNNRNEVVTNGTNDDVNTLADDVFGLKKIEDLVVKSNGAVSVDNAGKTEFTTEVVKGQKYVEFETGLDMIGHAATLYYTNEDKEMVVYAIVDEATLAVETTFNTNMTAMAKANGFDRDTSKTKVVDLDGKETTAVKGQPVILISNNGDKTLETVIALEQYVDYVEEINVNDIDEDDITTDYDCIVDDYADDVDAIVVGEIAEGDFVIVTKAQDDCFIIEAAETEMVYIDEIDRNNDQHVTIYVDGTAYKGNSKVDVKTAMVEDGFIAYNNVTTAGEYVLVFDQQGRVIGLVEVEETASDVNVAYVADFGWKINTEPSLKDAYRMTAAVYFADGTEGVYYVKKFNDQKVKVDELGYESKNDVYVDNLDAALYDVTLNDDKTVTINDLSVEVDASEIKQIKNKVTKVGENLYANSKTQFWFINGTYDDDMTVEVVTGIKNVPTVFKNGEALPEGVSVSDVYNTNADAEAKKTHKIVDTMIVYGFEEETTDEGIYLYLGNYTVKACEKGAGKDEKHYTVYKLYDAKTGEAATLTYTHDNYRDARDAGVACKDLDGMFVQDAGTKADTDLKAYANKNGYYVTGYNFEDYDGEGNEITIYTTHVYHISYDAKIMDEDTIFVDLTGNNMEDVMDLEAQIKANQKSWDKAAKKYVNNNKEKTPIDETVVAELAYVYDEDDMMSIIFVVDITKAFELDLNKYVEIKDNEA